MRQAVLLLAHGAPERMEDIESYLFHVRGGRPAGPAVIEEIKRRYAAIGGASPLSAWTRKQAEALQGQLQVPVYFAMRNWRPSIGETMNRIKTSAIQRIVAICLAPQYSEMSVGLYIRRTEEARQQAGIKAEIVWTRSFHDHPLLIEAFSEKLAGLITGRRVLFTAHSLPEKILANGDPYDSEVKVTACAVAERTGLVDWDFAYQSQGMTGEKWLGPAVERVIDRYAAEGVREFVLAPIGFVCDHVEILYDVDILFRQYAASRGITLLRPESLNDSPTFIAALAQIASEKLA